MLKKIEQNKIGVNYFVHIQRLAVESIAMNICKLFETEKDFRLNSIHGILQYIEEEEIPCQNIGPIKNFVLMHGNDTDEDNVIGSVSLVCTKFHERHKEDLKKFREFRSKRVAHAENITVEMNTHLPSHSIAKKFLTFGIGFYSSIQESYIGSFPIQHKSDKKVATSTVNLLKSIGLSDIKKEFIQ